MEGRKLLLLVSVPVLVGTLWYGSTCRWKYTTVAPIAQVVGLGRRTEQPDQDRCTEVLATLTMTPSLDDRKAPPTQAHFPKPNVIFMMADDVGYGDVHYNGGNADTPNLDAMIKGKHSIHLTRYYSGAPVCSPTRGSVLTGRNSNRYCIWEPNVMQGRPDFTVASKYPLPPYEITVAEIMKQHGYRTAVFGKWHIGDLKPVKGGHKKWPVSHPGMHGFDEWWVTPGSAPTLQTNCACFNSSQCPMGHYGRNLFSCLNYYTINSSTNELEGWPIPMPDDDSHFMFERLSEFLKTFAETKQPFFVYFPFHTVHHKYLANAKYRELYFSRGHNLNQADYYGAISAMDEVVGQVRILLQQYKLSENTMLWFTSDNGPELDTPGSTAGMRGKKYTVWEGGIRLPGIIEWPAVIKENRVSDFPVVSSDLLPTVCDILGVEPPTDRPIDGMSIMPFLRGEVTERNKSIAWAYNYKGINGIYTAALLRNQYKLVANYNGGVRKMTRLFNVVDNPNEHDSKDLSKSHSALLHCMLQELNAWRHSVAKSHEEESQCGKYQ